MEGQLLSADRVDEVSVEGEFFFLPTMVPVLLIGLFGVRSAMNRLRHTYVPFKEEPASSFKRQVVEKDFMLFCTLCENTPSLFIFSFLIDSICQQVSSVK